MLYCKVKIEFDLWEWFMLSDSIKQVYKALIPHRHQRECARLFAKQSWHGK